MPINTRRRSAPIFSTLPRQARRPVLLSGCHAAQRQALRDAAAASPSSSSPPPAAAVGASLFANMSAALGARGDGGALYDADSGKHVHWRRVRAMLRRGGGGRGGGTVVPFYVFDRMHKGSAGAALLRPATRADGEHGDRDADDGEGGDWPTAAGALADVATVPFFARDDFYQNRTRGLPEDAEDRRSDRARVPLPYRWLGVGPRGSASPLHHDPFFTDACVQPRGRARICRFGLYNCISAALAPSTAAGRAETIDRCCCHADGRRADDSTPTTAACEVQRSARWREVVGRLCARLGRAPAPLRLWLLGRWIPGAARLGALVSRRALSRAALRG